MLCPQFKSPKGRPISIFDRMEAERTALDRDLVLYARRVILAALDGLPDGYRVTVRRTAPTKQVQGMQSGIPEDTTQPQRRIKT